LKNLRFLEERRQRERGGEKSKLSPHTLFTTSFTTATLF